MIIKVQTSVLRETKWHEYAVRFALGGAITATAGLIAKEFGPKVGGLFLAFPAIFPATATLAESRERERKKAEGLSGVKRGRQAAAADAAGTTLGSLALLAFAVVFWKLLPNVTVWLVFVIAVLVWTAIAVGAWFASKRLRIRRKHAIISHRVST